MNEHQRNSVIARNEDLSGPNKDEHPENCTCWRCDLNKEGITDLEAYKENYLTCTKSVDI